MKLERKRPRQPAGSLLGDLCQDIEANILRPFPASACSPPRSGIPMHLGSLLRSMVLVARKQWASVWPEHCCILTGSMAEATRQLQAQPAAKLILCILQTEHHWALLAASRGHKEFLVFDGQTSDAMDDAASSFAQHARELGWCEVETVWVDQTDAWSCGARAVTAAAAVVAEFSSDGSRWPPKLKEGDFSDAMVETVSASLQAVFEAPAINVKAEADRPAKKVKPKPQAAAVPDLFHDDEDDAAPATPTRPSRRDRSRTPPLEKQVQKKARQGSAPKRKAKKLSKKQQEEQDRAEGARQAKAAGITFNQQFQKVHAQNLDHVPASHWPEFCKKLAQQAPMRCKSCRLLRDKIHPPSAAAEPLPHPGKTDAPAADALVAQSEPLPEETHAPAPDALVESEPSAGALVSVPAAKRRPGRPGRDEVLPTLANWVQKERRGIYTHVVGNTWKCVLCAKELQCRRPEASGHTYMLDHEKSKLHRQLHRGDVQAPAQEKCTGVCISNGQVPELDKFSGSFRKWAASGQLSFNTASSSDPLQQTSIAWCSEDLFLKHTDCQAQKVGGSPACTKCLTLAQSKALHLAVAKWSFRIDLASYGRALAVAPEASRREAQEVLLTADYLQISEIKRDVDGLLGIQDEEKLFRLIKCRFQAIPSSRQPERVRAWLETNLFCLTDKAGPDSERAVYDSLCKQFHTCLASGKFLREDLDMAAKIAVGGIPLVQFNFSEALV